MLASTAAAATALTPSRVLVARGNVTALDLTGRTVVVATGVSPKPCAVLLWRTWKQSAIRVAPGVDCTIETSTGVGIAAVSAAADRVVWLAYAGGNTREWSLFTATPSARRPLRLRFSARSVDGPPPIVLGPGTAEGIPYGVNRELVYLANDGTRLFRVVTAEPVRLVASGRGPNGIRVVAYTSAGSIVALTASGVAGADDIVVKEPVRSLRLFRAGIAYQVGDLVHIARAGGETLVDLPVGATMVDAAGAHILYQRAGGLGAVSVADGRTEMIVDGTRAQPAAGQLDAAGFAWAQRAAVSWRAGTLPAGSGG